MSVFYQGTGTKLTASGYQQLAAMFGLELAKVRAVFEVEARGSGFYANNTVTKLYEPHIAYKYSSGAVRAALVKMGIAYPVWRAGYPADSSPRVDACTKVGGAELAAMCTSWGLGQIMGFNFKAAGYSSALAMVTAFAQSEYNQALGMLNFIKSNPSMFNALKNGNWATFARLYNGSGYAKNRYDVKLKQAYLKWSAPGNKPKDTAIIDDILDRGDKGPLVYDLQMKLKAIGYNITPDKDFGKLTEDTVRSFQKSNGLKQTGQADDGTLASIMAAYYKVKAGIAHDKNVVVVPSHVDTSNVNIPMFAPTDTTTVMERTTTAAASAPVAPVVPRQTVFPGKDKDDLIANDPSPYIPAKPANNIPADQTTTGAVIKAIGFIASLFGKKKG